MTTITIENKVSGNGYTPMLVLHDSNILKTCETCVPFDIHVHAHFDVHAHSSVQKYICMYFTFL